MRETETRLEWETPRCILSDGRSLTLLTSARKRKSETQTLAFTAIGSAIVNIGGVCRASASGLFRIDGRSTPVLQYRLRLSKVQVVCFVYIKHIILIIVTRFELNLTFHSGVMTPVTRTNAGLSGI